MVMSLTLRPCYGSANAQTADEFCHRLRRVPPMVFNDRNNRAADRRRIGKLAHRLKLLRTGDAEADGDGQLAELLDAANQFSGVCGQLFLLTGDSGSGNRIDKALGKLGDRLESSIRAGGSSQKDGC